MILQFWEFSRILDPELHCDLADIQFMAATSPALSYLTQSTTTCSPLKASSIAARSADELCDELLEHMLDCDLCLNRNEHTCSAYGHYQGQIALAGRPQKGMVFAF
jgi:hypothetical protein